MEKQKVALIKGDLRYANIIRVLESIKPEILQKIKDKTRIVIKPNCVSDKIQLSAIHVDVLRAILDFLTKTLNYSGKITIAEGSAYSTLNAFKNFGYYSLKNKYNLKFIDLNQDQSELIEIYDRKFNKIKVGVAKTLLDSDFVISASLLKTHDSVIATFGIKNIAVGSLIKKTVTSLRIPVPIVRQVFNRIATIRNDKVKIHQGPVAINKNIFEIYKKIKPDLSIIDGFEAMEGNGPVDGTAVKMNVALGGMNAISVDSIASKLIGLEPFEIGYLDHIIKYEDFDPENILIIGNTTVDKEKRKLKLHDKVKSQLCWK